MTARACVFAAVFGVVLLAGCSGPMMASVKGKVTCNGQPVREAAITFSPVPKDEKDREAGKPGTGFTEPDGTFVLSTFSKHDGALVGPHRVKVVLDETNPAKCKREKELSLEVVPGGSDFTIELNN